VSAFGSHDLSPNLSPTGPHRVTSDGRVGTGRIRDRIGRDEWAWPGSPRTGVKALITRRSRVQIPPPPPSNQQIQRPRTPSSVRLSIQSSTGLFHRIAGKAAPLVAPSPSGPAARGATGASADKASAASDCMPGMTCKLTGLAYALVQVHAVASVASTATATASCSLTKPAGVATARGGCVRTGGSELPCEVLVLVY